MNSVAHEQPWSKQRWRTVIGLVFFLHVGLVFFFGAKQFNPPRQSQIKTVLRTLPGTPRQQQLAEFLTVEDPTLFALPNPHGFSGPAWLHQAVFDYKTTNWNEAPEWLQLEITSLGETLKFDSAAGSTSMMARADTPNQPLFKAELIGGKPVYSSKLAMDPELSARWSGGQVPLKSQPWSDALEPTQVQVGIDHEGRVLSAGIWKSSGSKQADADALQTAKTLLFDPIPSVAGKIPSTALTWGRLTFQWFAVPLPK